jgi:hypothetical protein
MPSQRFLLVEGVFDGNGRGHPVTDPHNPSASPARFAGWQYAPKMRDDGKGAEEVDGLIDHYKPVRQIIADHIDLRSAAKKGHLKIHDECVAKDHDEARARLNSQPTAKTTNKPTAGGSQ